MKARSLDTPVSFSEAERSSINMFRSILMICVVYIHSYALPTLPFAFSRNPLVQKAISYFTGGFLNASVPLFFVLSAVLLYSRPFSFAGNVKKKLRTLVIPYLLINTLWIVLFKLVEYTPLASAVVDTSYQVKGLKDFFDCYIAVFEREMPMYYPFWFIKDLIVLNFIAVFFKKAVDRAPAIFLILLVVLHFSGIELGIIRTSSVIYWCIGCYIAKYIDCFRWILDKLPKWTLLIVYVLALVIIPIVNRNFADVSILLYLAEGIMLFDFCLWLSATDKASVSGTLTAAGARLGQFLIWLSQYVFIIYAFHEFAEAFLKRGIMSVIPQTVPVQILEYIFIPVIIIALCVVFGIVLRKYLPRLYAIIVGGR